MDPMLANAVPDDPMPYPSFEGSRCAPAWRWPHYGDSMSQIAYETEWMGWEADGENCKTYYRLSEIKG